MAARLFQMQPWPHEIPEPVRRLLNIEVLQEFVRLIAKPWQGSGRENNFRKAIKFGLRMAACLPNNAERLAGRSIMLLTAFDHYWLRACLGERGYARFSRRLFLRMDFHKAVTEQFPIVAVQLGLRLARLQSLTDINRAADLYKDTLEAFAKLTGEPGWTDMSRDETLLRADIEYELAETLYWKGKCLEAAKHVSEAVNCLERSGLSKGACRALVLQGLCLAGSGGRDFEALAALKRAREIATSCGDVVNILSVYRNMSFFLAKFGHVKAAANLLDSAYTKFQSLGKVDVEATCLMADMLAKEGGRADLAVNLLEDSFGQYKSQGDFRSAFECAHARIDNAIEKGQLTTATKWLKEVRHICLPELGPAYRGELYLCIADIAYATGLQPWLALHASQRAGRILKKHGSLKQLRRCSVTHALACAECGYMEHALYYLDIAFSLPLHSDRAQRAAILANAGSVYGRLCSFDESISLLERAIAIQLDCGAWNSAAFALRQLGAIYYRLNKLDSANECWTKSLELFQLAGSPLEIANTVSNLAACMSSQGMPGEAQKYQTLAIKVLSSVQKHVEPVLLLTNLGVTYLALGQPKKALQTFERSYTAAVRQTQSPLRQMRPLLGMARSNLRLGFKNKALDCFEKAIKLIEAYRGSFKLGRHRSGITQLSLEAYIELIALSCELGRSHLALDMIQRANNRALFEAIASTVAASRVSSSKSFDKEEFDPRLAEEHGVRSRDPQRLIRSVQKEPLATKTILNLLQDRCLIQYFVHQNTLVCCTVSKYSGVHMNVIPIGSLFQFTQKVDNLIKNFLCRPKVAKTLVNINKPLHNFYGDLIRPVEGILKHYKAVIIVPSGPLYNIPFSCLFDGQHYLAERYFISYLPHIAMLEHSKTVDVSPRSWAGFGNPNGDLEYVEAEFERIPAMFDQSVVRTGVAATAKALWSSTQHASVLHIATRVKRDSNNPYNATFQVADKNGTDWVPFADVLKTKHKVTLAVLRCCYTGEARPWIGGEIAAVWTLFLLAGCKAVLASPWQVYERQDVSQLIIRFYELWVKDGKPLVEALTLAQREAIKQGSFPAMWGFPLLIGNV